MKARVKATGEIVEVVKDGPFYNDIDGYERYYEHELDFQDVISYWDKLLHQYAGMAMQGILSNPELFKATAKNAEEFGLIVPQAVAIDANCFAHALVEKMKEAGPMKGLFIRGIDAELRQSLIDCGFEPVKQDIYFNGTMVTSDGKLWHPSEPFKPWNPDGKGWPECKVFNNTSDFLNTAKEMLKEERK